MAEEENVIRVPSKPIRVGSYSVSHGERNMVWVSDIIASTKN